MDMVSFVFSPAVLLASSPSDLLSCSPPLLLAPLARAAAAFSEHSTFLLIVEPVPWPFVYPALLCSIFAVLILSFIFSCQVSSLLPPPVSLAPSIRSFTISLSNRVVSMERCVPLSHDRSPFAFGVHSFICSPPISVLSEFIFQQCPSLCFHFTIFFLSYHSYLTIFLRRE